jgi:hypothetical protein
MDPMIEPGLGKSSELAARMLHSARVFFLVAICGVIAVVQVQYVGSLTIYSSDLESKRADAHDAIFDNIAPGGNWQKVGMNSTNIRILSVYLAEFETRVLGISHASAYKILDVLALFLSLLVLYLFIQNSFGWQYGMLGIFFIGNLLPMTFWFHYFHPWDRLGLLLWVSYIFAINKNKYGLAVLLLILAVLNKHDSIVLPCFYLFANFSLNNVKQWVPRALALFVVAGAVFVCLRLAIPGGFGESDVSGLLSRNINNIGQMNILYPPFLVFILPALLAVIGWKESDQFSKAGLLLAAMVLIGPMFFLSNFEEVRAHMGVLVLMLPATLYGLRKITKNPVAIAL